MDHCDSSIRCIVLWLRKIDFTYMGSFSQKIPFKLEVNFFDENHYYFMKLLIFSSLPTKYSISASTYSNDYETYHKSASLSVWIDWKMQPSPSMYWRYLRLLISTLHANVDTCPIPVRPLICTVDVLYNPRHMHKWVLRLCRSMHPICTENGDVSESYTGYRGNNA